MKNKMLDTVRFYSIGRISDFTDRNNLINKLNKARDTYDYDTCVDYVSGKLGNMQIQEHEHGFYIQGSISKYYFGNNIQTLSITQLKECVERLEDDFDIPISDLPLSRVDLADCITLTYKPKVYYNCLHSFPRMEKVILGNGIRFENKSRSLRFYDKIEERMNKRQYIPESLREKNLLRYEYRMDERLEDYFDFKIDNITAFYNSENWTKSINTWHTQFEKIIKVESSLTKVSDLTNDFKYKERNEMEFLLTKGGEGFALDEIEIMYDLKKYSCRRQVNREKTRIKKLFERYNNIDNTGYSFKTEICDRVSAKAIENKIVLMQ